MAGEALTLPRCQRISGNGVFEDDWPERVGNWRRADKFPAPRDGSNFIGFFGSATKKTQGYVARQDMAFVHYCGWGGGVWEGTTGGHRWSLDELTYWRPELAGPFDDVPEL